MNETVQRLVQNLGLQPHPEGGYFREIFRSKHQVKSPFVASDRATLTHIYFLLMKGQVSRFHRVAHEEVWNFYAGAPLRLVTLQKDSLVERILDPSKLQFCSIVPPNVFQAAESTGAYSLVGCSVAPGFDFADFEFMDPTFAEARKELLQPMVRFL